MVEINSINRQNNLSKIEPMKNQNKKIGHTNFKEKLESLKQEEIKNELKILFSKIENQSTKLQDRLFIEDLVEYKKLVKDFLDVSVNNSHIFYKENSLDRRGRHRVYSLVKKVDTELDELTKDFLNIEDNRIRILNRLDDIKGLLLDILT
ncbi:YaaR family protein [Anaerosalibacter massiliensis]|uniref:YaaR family protein n=1 Tax=Anaerosalibacter massiliensis TaxID=1347392 RepID=A0A9X2MJN4_9FIRM|nr:YaaR family protein [Anaerosalibacter massiliensis]MCR2044290.1 YaaR family protein [Anaerosalibacter massiliensis]